MLSNLVIPGKIVSNSNLQAFGMKRNCKSKQNNPFSTDLMSKKEKHGSFLRVQGLREENMQKPVLPIPLPLTLKTKDNLLLKGPRWLLSYNYPCFRISSVLNQMEPNPVYSSLKTVNLGLPLHVSEPYLEMTISPYINKKF